MISGYLAWLAACGSFTLDVDSGLGPSSTAPTSTAPTTTSTASTPTSTASTSTTTSTSTATTTSSTTTATDPVWDTARLELVAPTSGAFLAWSVPSTFEARVVDTVGNDLGVTAITWTSDVDGGWTRTGSTFTDDSLDVGQHAITAETRLPNGDRLASTVGGVLVQSAYAGTYAGSLSVSIEIQGIPITCNGAIELVVDAYGDTVYGEVPCAIDISGFELDTPYVVDLAHKDGDLTGSVSLDVFGFLVDLPFQGTLTEDGALDGAFSGEILTLPTAGDLEATRVTRDLP